MFDIGFLELLVIAIVGLVIIGPERLPETARAIGLWIGRLKRSMRETRSELEKQFGADDIRRQLHNEEVMRSLEATRRQIQDAVQEGALENRPKSLKDEREDATEAAQSDRDVKPESNGKEADDTPTNPKPSVGSSEDAPTSTRADSHAHSDSKKSS